MKIFFKNIRLLLPKDRNDRLKRWKFNYIQKEWLPFSEGRVILFPQLWLDKLEENFITLYGHKEALQDA